MVTNTFNVVWGEANRGPKRTGGVENVGSGTRLPIATILELVRRGERAPEVKAILLNRGGRVRPINRAPCRS